MGPIARLSLTAFALCSAAAGQALSPEAASFEVASIRASESGGSGYFRPAPDGFTAGNTTVKLLIETAYGIQDYQIKGGPAWLGVEEYDFAAKAGRAINPAELSAMLQNLLSDRFRLMLHKEARKLDGYALVVAKGGPKLRDPTGPRAAVTRTNTVTDTKVDAHHLGLASMVGMIQGVVGRPVLDKTGLTGAFDFTLQWRRETAPGGDSNDKLAEACSASTTTAQGGFYTTVSKGGTIIGTTTTALTNCASSTTRQRLTALTNMDSTIFTAATIYPSLTAAQGGTDTADIDIHGIPYN